ncbi:MAG: hypothetical protein OXE42_06575 [Gammaproteobacteria bacterium]|nr:hypothetical protein [Gammaproteobacteria bacterium]
MSSFTMPAPDTVDIEVAPVNGEYPVLCRCDRTAPQAARHQSGSSTVFFPDFISNQHLRSGSSTRGIASRSQVEPTTHWKT